MVLKAAVVFIAGGLTGSGIVALTNALNDSPLPAATLAVAAPMSDARSGEIEAMQVDSSASPRQASYIQGYVAAQRPFAALHAPKR